MQSSGRSLVLRGDLRSRRYRLVLALIIGAVMTLTGCKSSSHATSPTTVVSSGPSTTGSSSSAPASTSAPSTASSAPKGSPTLVLPLCQILDAATVNRVMGTNVGACQEFSPEGEAGRCLWGTLGAATTTVQLTAFTGAQLATRKLGWQAAFPAVPGVGQGAWSRGPIPLGKIVNVVLYVDYGSFGMEFAVSSPTATLAMAVALGQAVK